MGAAGGRPDPDDVPARTIEREIVEETGAVVSAVRPIGEWPYEVLPARFVWIVAWGCRPLDLSRQRASTEHSRLGWFAPAELDGLPIPAGYVAAV